ncbi:hypothetical protein SLS57_008357 [Botryosphaeria dothidea]
MNEKQRHVLEEHQLRHRRAADQPAAAPGNDDGIIEALRGTFLAIPGSYEKVVQLVLSMELEMSKSPTAASASPAATVTAPPSPQQPSSERASSTSAGTHTSQRAGYASAQDHDDSHSQAKDTRQDNTTTPSPKPYRFPEHFMRDTIETANFIRAEKYGNLRLPGEETRGYAAFQPGLTQALKLKPKDAKIKCFEMLEAAVEGVVDVMVLMDVLETTQGWQTAAKD